MSEYLVKRQSLENIADEIRVLSGTTEPLGLTEMATNVNDANDEVADQTDLIAQVVSALQGKSIPGGGEDVTEETATYTDLLTDLEAAVDALPDAGSGGIETCTVTVTYNASGTLGYFGATHSQYVNGEYTVISEDSSRSYASGRIYENVPVGSLFVICYSAMSSGFEAFNCAGCKYTTKMGNGYTVNSSSDPLWCFTILPDNNGVATIHCYDND